MLISSSGAPHEAGSDNQHRYARGIACCDCSVGEEAGSGGAIAPGYDWERCERAVDG
jgi:hypothetical protein